MKHLSLLGLTGLLALSIHAQPYTQEQLQLRVSINLSTDLAIPANSMFNPVIVDGDVYVNQINTGATAFGRYTSGTPEPTMMVNNIPNNLEHRMVVPFRGSYKRTYLLASGSGATLTTTMSRYDYDGTNRVDAAFPDAMTVEGFDWADDDTIVCTSYTSGSRRRIYLADVVAEPFAINRNTTWNANGYITSAATTRIRNVRRGDKYPGHAYYGDAGQNNNPAFFAVDLATGAETLLGNAGALTGGGSFGIWTVLERGGYLYVQTTDNGIQVYPMNSATSLGALLVTYEKWTLDMVTGNTGQFYGLDVSRDGKRLVLGAAPGLVHELGSPIVGASMVGSELQLSWPASVTAVIVQSASSLSPDAFADMAMPPVVWVEGKYNKANVPAAEQVGYYRLKRAF